MADFDPKIIEQFQREFDACQALYDFAKAHRPEGPPTPDDVGDLILRTYRRSTKTYAAVLRLAGVGYGEQATMLNRPLFEDMVVAHWIKRHPDSPEKLERFRLFTLEDLREAAHRFDRDDYLSKMPPPLPRTKRRKLKDEFAGQQHWTGKTLDKLVNEIKDEWKSPADQRFLLGTYEFGCGGSNAVLHHGHVALSVGIAGTSDTTAYSVAASPEYVREALGGAFFAYANTASLVLDATSNEELNKLYFEQFLGTFTKVSIRVESGNRGP